MRRRHNYTPKPPKVRTVKQTLPRPKPAKLIESYRKLQTAQTTVRVAALEEALAWWDVAVPYYLTKGPLSAAQQKRFTVANKARALGVGASTDEERETAYKQTIQQLELIWGSAPKLAKHWSKFQAKKAVLEKREQQLTQRFQPILDGLNTAFQPLGLTFIVHKHDKPRQFDGRNKIMLNSDLAKSLVNKQKAEGLLPVLFSEAHTALYAASIELTPEGTPITKLDKLAKLVPVMLESILKYCNAVPRNKVFRGYDEAAGLTADPATGKPTPVRQPRQPRTPGTSPGPRGPRTGERIGGRYTPGSAMAVLFERLQDQKTHKLSEVLAGIPSGNPMDRFKWIVKHGQETGDWNVVANGQDVTMTILKAGIGAQVSKP